MPQRANSKKASLLASFFEGAWRSSPPTLKISAEQLEEIAPMLLGSGAGPLGWWRVKNTDLCESRAVTELHEAYRLHSIQSLLYSHKIKLAFSLLRSHGIEPILIKGWASARLYPDAALRPYGDVDLCVRPDEYEQAQVVMDSPEGRECWVDLHAGMGRHDDTDWDELRKRSQLLNLDGVQVRVLGPEDHLRLSCVHFLDHGAWRPIWLCDIAAGVEAVTEAFDWDACLGRDERRAKWALSAIGLAHGLLGARLEHCPEFVRSARLPGWLMPCVLKSWERPCVKEHSPPELIMVSLRHPSRMPRAMINRWPNPIEATVRVRGAFNEMPRLPFQVKDYLIQTGKFLARLKGLPKAAARPLRLTVGAQESEAGIKGNAAL